MRQGCDIMISKAREQMSKLKAGEIEVVKGANSMECVDIILEDEDYDLAKPLEYILYDMYFEKQKIYDYIAVNQPHPHDNYIIIRISMSKPELMNKENIYIHLDMALQQMENIYEAIHGQI